MNTPYVFDHVSGELPMKYILSAFWEGQEGSFYCGCSGTWSSVAFLIKINDEFNTEVMYCIVIVTGLAQFHVAGHLPSLW